MTTADAIKELMTAWDRVYKIVSDLNPTWTAEQVYQATAKVIRDKLKI